jgi:predicted metalloprotease with PDZ domain
MSEPHTHLLEVELHLTDVAGPVELVMPSWTPGSYLLREFGRHVQDLSARSGAAAVPWRKMDKSSWRVETEPGAELVVSYRVYANELSVRTSHLDATHASINGASVFLFARGYEKGEHEVEVLAPSGWRTTTVLAQIGESRFVARSYDELVDSPLEIGTHLLLEWEQSGRPHQFAIWGSEPFDADRLLDDTREIIAAAERMFGGLPYSRYIFFLHLVPDGRGGLEHRECSALQADRWALPAPGAEPDEKYEDFLALVAHEFFHVWNVKRIRSEVLGPFDYTRENYTRSLWVAEGLTTYYTDRLLLWAARIPEARYLERLSDQIARFQALPGRHRQTLADSSFDSWVRFYRPDEHTPNAQISYYQKGALVGLLLDLEIRRATAGARSLDDLMRLLWERYGARDVGYPETGPGSVEALAAEVAGTDLSGFFDAYIRGTAELDYDRALAAAGMRIGPTPAPASPTKANAAPASDAEASTTARPSPLSDAAEIEGRLGVRARERNGRVEIALVLEGGSGWRSGLNASDEIVALNGYRVASVARFATALRRAASTASTAGAASTANAASAATSRSVAEGKDGASVSLTVFRHDRLLTLDAPLGASPAPRLRITEMEGGSTEAAVGAGWLGGRASAVSDERAEAAGRGPR